jgi:hypothetical protein
MTRPPSGGPVHPIDARGNVMKKLSIASGLLFSVAPLTLYAETADSNLAEARTLVKQFAGELQAEVAAGMKAGGPVHTIEICSAKAPAIAAGISQSSGWQVGRTSLKLRNPANTPDAWEMQVLEQFEARKAAGEPVEKLEFAEVVGSGQDRQYRYMKAIPTAEVCLNCHAAEIKPPVEEKLSQIYPQDQARGFSVGDIRGAFTLSKTD